MAKLHPKPKPKVRWSEETIRRRGVRAVVAALRLSKEYQQLSREHASHMEEAAILKQYLERVRTLNRTLRDLLKREKAQLLSHPGNGNTWMHNGDSHPIIRSSRRKN